MAADSWNKPRQVGRVDDERWNLFTANVKRKGETVTAVLTKAIDAFNKKCEREDKS